MKTTIIELIESVFGAGVRLARRSHRIIGWPLLLGALLAGLGLLDPGVARAASEAAAPGDPAMTTSKGAAIVFWLFALGTLGGSIFVITRRNLITAVMGMVGTFFTLAALFAMLYASFLTAIQVLVYAGAIMVLFVFVIMILNKPEAEPWSTTGVVGKVVTVGLLLYLLFRFVQVLWGIAPPPGALAAPPADFGSTRKLGETLFTDYLFPFEAVSLVLLIAVVGAIAVARPHERRPSALDGAEGSTAE